MSDGDHYRDYKPTVPPAVTYGLTARGEDLHQMLDTLNEISLRWDKEEKAARTDEDAASANAAV
ncbi:MAG: winged helix-turn-helix transcriptional regulator [Alphaproteobacteria bacterium]|nr:winged helix-turn-helix transcriptional regulator [Alphaproteobacteria bacterium]